MKISKQSRRDAKQLFRSCLPNGVLDENRVRQVVNLVIAQKPRGYVAILSHFERLVKLAVARRTATVECAVPLDPAMQASIQASLTRIHGPGLRFLTIPNPSLLGGLRIQVGSDVYDGSIRTRLQDLAEQM